MTVARNAGVELPIYVDGNGDKKMIFAHGLQGLGSRALPGCKPLIDAGWTVACFDQRGHGDATPIFETSGYDADEMGRDLWAVADALGWDRCVIGGGSMGAATSFRAALLAPERVETLVQVCPALSNIEHQAVWLFGQVANQLRDEGIDGLIALWSQYLEQLGATPEQIAFLEDLREHDPKSLECALRSVPRWVFDDFPDAFRSMSFPVHVVCWDNDYIHPIDVGRSVAEAAGIEPLEIDHLAVQDDPTFVSTILIDVLK